MNRRRAEPTGPRSLGGEQVEGRQAVLELLRAGRRDVHQVLATAPALEGAFGAELRQLARTRRVTVREVDREQLDRSAGTEAHQGVMALAAPLPEADLASLLASRAGPAFLVVLDGVTDPRNLGAVARTALSAGATGLVVARHRAAGLTPAAVKAAAGAVEHLPVAAVAGIPSALRALKAAGVWTVGLDADGPALLWGLPVATEPLALVLGAEGQGLARLTRDRCDVVARIPLVGPLGSLNVSAAAALACFEVARQRHPDGQPANPPRAAGPGS
jgi:23S rRNA (guanosine2251-2'-O)-methyltransferase